MKRLSATFTASMLLFLLFLSQTSPVMALDPGKVITQYNVQIWDMESGLPSNSVFVIRQTQEGYLWIGTQDGLIRFDGFNFQLYARGKTPGLMDNEVRALCEDRNGTLWIGTSTGGLTRCKHGEFTTYPIAKHEALHKIKAIEEDRRGNLWIGSFTGGLTCLSKGKFTTYTTKEGLPHNQVWSIYKDGNQDLWVVTSSGVVKIVEPGNFRVMVTDKELPGLKTTCLYEEDTGNLRIGTGAKGLFLLKNGIVKPYEPGIGISNLTINTLYRDRMKTHWIGTDGDGLFRVRNDGSIDYLDCGPVYSIYEDREGSLWVGTLTRGLYQIRDSKFTTYTTREGLLNDHIHCIYETRDNDLWIGTEGGLNRMKKGRLTGQLTTGEGLLSSIISCLFEDPAGSLWIGTWKGLHRWQDGKLTFLTKRDGLSDNRIKCISGDRQGNTWVGTPNGLNRIDNNNIITAILTTAHGLAGNSIEFIYEDEGGTLWIGTDSGLNYLKDGVISDNNAAAGFKGNVFRCAYQDKEGTLWFGTGSGLIRVKGKYTNPDTYTFDVQSGLVENQVYSILEDQKGYLWLAGRKGIARVSKEELQDVSTGKIHQVRPDIYNEKDGLKSRWITSPGYKTRDGKLWFPTSAGASMIDPNNIQKNILAPPLIIEKLIVDGEPVNIRTGTGGGKIVELPPGKKRLDFYYTALSFISPGKIKFKLMLEGFDSDWVDMGHSPHTTYTGLHPGKYTLKVIACNSDGVWNQKGASFSFYLQPYFYQTYWFYVLVVFLVILLAFTGYRIRVSQLRTRQKELQTQVQLRTRDLNERNLELENTRDLIEAKNRQLEEQSEKLKEMDKIKSRFFANISHEFRTPLTLIMGPLEQMLTAPEEDENQQEKKLRLMLRNSQRLLGLINQLLELAKFDSGTMKLQAARQNIVPFLKGILHAFDSLAVQKELELIFKTEAEEITLYFDPEKLEEAISNLLSNAVKFTPAGGRITLAVKIKKAMPATKDTDFLEVSVSDTGPGIPRDQLAHIFDRFYQADSTYEHHLKGTGIGLAIAREIVEFHGGSISAHSPEAEGSGTAFVIKLPMGDAHLAPEEIVDSSTARFKPHQPHKIPAIDVMEKEEEDAGQNGIEPGVPADDKAETINEVGIDAAMTGKNIILVVEDSADVREYIRSALETLYAVLETKNGQEGLEKAREIVPDLIICDIMMPGMNGYELCRELKNHRMTSHIPVILLTAKASEESIIEGLETGADDYITKPFSTKILLARIKNLIDLRLHLQQTLKREMTLKPAKMNVSPIDKEFLNDLQKVIEENISDPEFNVEELSKKLYIGRTTLYRKIHALSGESPTEFIRSYRLKQGAELLKKGFGSVLEVAFEVGFSSATYFTRCFKKKFHQLPTAFKEIESGSSQEPAQE
jgi:signal transduction histidine kinase/ligand-binding sensor domain-containing protein/DNA-binding response OmpR family regulator